MMTFLPSFRRLSAILTSTAVLAAVLSPLTSPHILFAAPLVDPLMNPGFEDAWTAAEEAYDWQNFGGGYSRTEDAAHTGEWSIRLTNAALNEFAGAYQRIDLDQAVLKPVFIGGWVRGSDIALSNDAWIGASIYAEIHLADGSIVYWNSVRNSGTFDWRWIGFNTGSLPQISQPIDYIFVVPILADATGTAWFDNVSVTEFDPNTPAVTLMFDDGETTTYTEAKPVMDAYGFVGTAAVVSDYVGAEGYMTQGQIMDLTTAGWEVASHGVTHDDFTLLSPAEREAQLRNSKQVLTDMGFSIKNVAYPYGAYDASLLAQTSAFYSSGRNYELGDNPQGVFPFDVKVRSAIDTTTPEEIAQWLTEAKTYNRWVVIVFHSISNAGDDAYHTPPELFSEYMGIVAESGIPVITYNDGIEQYATKQ